MKHQTEIITNDLDMDNSKPYFVFENVYEPLKCGAIIGFRCKYGSGTLKKIAYSKQEAMLKKKLR